MTARTSRARRVFVAVLVAVWVIVPPLLMLARWPRWWSWIAPELTPMTWLQSVTLVLGASASLLIGHVLALTGLGRTRPWWVLAVGFGALAVDERFAIHERLRDGVLAPRGVAVPFLPWVAPGDFLVLAMGLIGLSLLPMVWRAVREDAAARAALLLGVVLAGIAVAGDSIDPSTWTVRAQRVQQSTEEIIELASALALLASIGLRLLGLLGQAVSTPADALTDGIATDEPAPAH